MKKSVEKKIAEPTPLTWAQRLAAAKRRKPWHFTEDDHRCAGQWSCCYVGEEHRRQPLVVKMYSIASGPRDDDVFRLGVTFGHLVHANRVEGAEACMKKILACIRRLEKANAS